MIDRQLRQPKEDLFRRFFTDGSDRNVWRSGSLRAEEICPDPDHRDLVKLLASRGIPQEHIRQLIRNPQTGRALAIKTLRRQFLSEIKTAKVELKV